MPRRVYALSMMAVLLLGCGCDDDCPGRPETEAPAPTFANIWPNDDGSSWTYRVNTRSWGAPEPLLFATAEEVPPMPPISELMPLLAVTPTGETLDYDPALYRLVFEDSVTTPGGVRAQLLQEYRYSEPTGSFPLESGVWRAMAPVERFTRRQAALTDGLYSGSFPLLIHGYAWEKRDDVIGTYDFETPALTWKFFSSSLDVGTQHASQIIPQLSDDTFMHGYVQEDELTWETDYATYQRCLKVFYVIEFGPMEVVDTGGQSLGWCRTVDIGYVVYAPGVGPVESRERLDVDTSDPGDAGWMEVRATLIGATRQ